MNPSIPLAEDLNFIRKGPSTFLQVLLKSKKFFMCDLVKEQFSFNSSLVFNTPNGAQT
jgi:hypothetical protein